MKMEVLFEVKALYDFDFKNPRTLRFKAGDTIPIVKAVGEWWEGVLDGRKGLIPSNYVKVANEDNTNYNCREFVKQHSISQAKVLKEKQPETPVGSPKVNGHGSPCMSPKGMVCPTRQSKFDTINKIQSRLPRERALSVGTVLHKRDSKRDMEDVSFFIKAALGCSEFLREVLKKRLFTGDHSSFHNDFENVKRHKTALQRSTPPPPPQDTETLKFSVFVKRILKDDTFSTEQKTNIIFAHRYFGSSEEFFEALFSECKHAKAKPTMENATRKVLCILSEWISLVPRDFAENPRLAEKARKFIAETRDSQSRAVSDASQRVRLALDQSPGFCNFSPATAAGAPPPLLVCPATVSSIQKIPPIELARQLTLESFGVFKQMKLSELNSYSWNVKGIGTTSPTILALIKGFRETFVLVASEILSKKSSRKRKKAIKCFLEAAAECKSLRGYNTMMGIVCALNSPPVIGHTRSWNKKCCKALEQLLLLEADIFKEYSYGPGVPFVGDLLEHLFSIEERRAKDCSGINMEIFEEYAKLCAIVNQLQQGKYSLFQSLPILQCIKGLSSS